jgi:hydroxymethylglutaryl-CoA synthase
MMTSHPQNIGVKAIEIYFPSQVSKWYHLCRCTKGTQLANQVQCVDQSDLERFDGVAAGKYTIGLGQTKMSFCDDREGVQAYREI